METKVSIPVRREYLNKRVCLKEANRPCQHVVHSFGPLYNDALSKKIYDKYQLGRTGIPTIRMPSTSPANAAWSLERLVEEWRKYL